ncbi:ac18-like protein [Cryptophlebia peltastica nucleopolyhedrovirus]|uniref:Ac18-like protein n=1 Tax=Cryptophlebia peltastica nucleopolyhedrovirus TaxID=2304025 RepID=A0A346RNX9_9ABAC|nr:ac18-like protein [Cryptophlebia peltastica nucleopolyhedrovirus]AXS67776.1 ac18-like protein [Cryptophlebia peltastica nucleopolyhedrovirus]
MESLRQQLFYLKTIPYISKKNINDQLCSDVLDRFDKNFFCKLYKTFRNVFEDQFSIIKGTFAIDSYTDYYRTIKPYKLTNNLNIEIYLDNINEGKNALETLPIALFENAISNEFRDDIIKVEQTLKMIDMKFMLNQIDGSKFDQEFNNGLVFFKSYVNEAIKIDSVNDVYFEINRNAPFKTTSSWVNDEFLLVRFSFNVHMKSASPIWNYKSDNSVNTYVYFPFDVYFLDLVIKNSYEKINLYNLVEKFDTYVCVVNINLTIADQLECLLFDVFNRVPSIQNRLEILKDLLRSYNMPTTEKQLQKYANIKRDKNMINIRNVKTLFYKTNPRLGARLVIELYFAGRFRNSITDITHQINFPYVKEQGYFSKCWKIYLQELNRLFHLNFTIKKIN